MSEGPHDLNKTVLDTLIRFEPGLLDSDDEAVKRTSFVLANLLGMVLALACVRHGADAYEHFAGVAKRQIDKSSKRLDLNEFRAAGTLQ